jgi:NADH-quinone oxidoreductase subunit N
VISVLQLAAALVPAATNNDQLAIHPPSIEYAALAPMLIVFGAASLGVLLEAFLPRTVRGLAQTALALAALTAGLIDVLVESGTRRIVVEGAVAIDGPALFIQGTILAVSIGGLLLIADRSFGADGDFVAQAADVPGSADERASVRAGFSHTEVFPLALFAVAGMLLFCSANDLITMFVALEVLSLPLYLLVGMARRRRLLSQEAALKYFLLGAFASAFFLYGIALLYGYADSVDLSAIFDATRSSTKSDVLLYGGLALLLVGLLFKASVAPFHNWTPDVYQGAPTPVSAFMASCTKVAAFGGLLRVLYVAFSGTAWNWRPIIWAVAIASMAVGAIVGLTQTDIKRILAYSSIAHAGFILVGLVAVTKDASAGVLFYVLTYGFSTMAAFGLLMLVRDADGEATHLSQWSGLARKSPVVALVMTVLLMSMAGIPLTAGFTGKFFVFRSAWHTAGPLVVLALVFSAIAAFYYLRIIVMMYFADPPENGPTIAIPGWSSSVALTVGVVVTVILGVFPQPVLDLATKAASSLIG